MDIVEKNIKKLFEAKDGSTACAAMDLLKKKASADNRKQIIEALMKYSIETEMDHLKSLTLIWINNLIEEDEKQYADYYINKIESENMKAAYYAIEGYCKIMQKDSYEYLVSVLLSKKLDMECNALIVCQLSSLSNNPFDMNTPYDKPEWNEKHLKIDEISAWRDAGYPEGNGYEEPKIHICLLKPSTPEEKVYSRLDTKLKKKREKNTDKAHPSAWLTKAEDTDMKLIKEKWNLPNNYLDFLIKASPLNVTIKLKGYGLVRLFGADNLIEGQYGYSYNPVEGKDIEEWPKNYIVIGSCNANPFCIDITQENSPIYYAQIEMGKWDFDVSHNTLLDFLKSLG